ncbi:hypothetical protein CEP54_014314 [Fusarium duplospermum]|uniref:Alpha/beta hydrolase fold-3 domain-containing protein n=1 Tax=Fusarium duplospermum TaxID=1325734 RepID=A0A428NXA5_9HYPO|nr:hypothetical protein CEP54_014314 [Fusarium duplospermum]
MTDFLWKFFSAVGFARPDNQKPDVTSGESVQLQGPTTWSGSENAAIHRLARVVFGLGEDEICKWPGYQIFIQHIRTQLHDTGSLWLEPAITRTVSTETTTPSFSEYLDFISDISELIQNSTTNNFSIDDLVDQLNKRQKGESLTPGSKESVVYRQALFCVLAWVTLLLDIPPAPSQRHFQAIFPDDIPHTQATRLLSDAQRPVHALFKSLCQRKLPDSSRNQTTHEADQWFGLIHVSSVSYSMLYEFGKVAIEWTTSMTCHLQFDASTRTLYLFRLPTYCALGCVHSSQDCVFDRLMQHYFDGSGERHNNVWLRYRQEVLLSYRILFGHDEKSRRMFRQLQKNDETTLSDPLLGHPFPAAPNNCLDGTKWLVDNGPRIFGHALVFIGGESAGANLALQTALGLLCSPAERYPRFNLQGLLLHYGAFSLHWQPGTRHFRRTPALVFHEEAMTRFRSAYLPGEDPASHTLPDVSPFYAELSGLHLPPLLITCGTEDCLLEDNVFMATRWMMASGQAVLHIFPGSPHGFILFPSDVHHNAQLALKDVCG